MDTIRFKSDEQVAEELAELLMRMDPGEMVLVSRYHPELSNRYKVFTIRKAEGGVVDAD